METPFVSGDCASSVRVTVGVKRSVGTAEAVKIGVGVAVAINVGVRVGRRVAVLVDVPGVDESVALSVAVPGVLLGMPPGNWVGVTVVPAGDGEKPRRPMDKAIAITKPKVASVGFFTNAIIAKRSRVAKLR
jgi:hypothetical protein